MNAIAQADQNRKVKQFCEYYGDYLALDPQLFTLSLNSIAPLLEGFYSHKSFQRIVEGLASVCLSMKVKPFVRYQANSEVCSKIAEAIGTKMDQENDLFSFASSPPLLLILDRREDPITPLIMTWAYQPLLHELTIDGIRNNVITITDKTAPSTSSSSNTAPQMTIDEIIEKLVSKMHLFMSDGANMKQKDPKKPEEEDSINGDYELSYQGNDESVDPEIRKISKKYPITQTDQFLNENKFRNWGDLCLNLRENVEKYQEQADMRGKFDNSSIEEMYQFLLNFKNVKEFTGSTENHVNLVHFLKAQIKKRNLFSISELEQEMVASPYSYSNHSQHLNQLFEKLKDPTTSKFDCFKLVVLYTLRFQTHPKNATPELLDSLVKDKGFDPKDLRLVSTILKYCGKAQRNSKLGLFPEETESALGAAANTVASLFTKVVGGGLAGEVNVFTQHKPLLAKVLDHTFKGKLNPLNFPFFGRTIQEAPKDVIVFVVGGVTYEESMLVHSIYKSSPNRSVILGGDKILNSREFFKEMKRLEK